VNNPFTVTENETSNEDEIYVKRSQGHHDSVYKLNKHNLVG